MSLENETLDNHTCVNIIRIEAKRAASSGDHDKAYRILDQMAEHVIGPVSPIDWPEIWEHFNRMQQRIMDSITTKEEFLAESELDRMDFYNWMKNQCGEYADLI